MDLIFYLLHYHHWTPEQYIKMGYGGRDLTWGLVLHEIEITEEAMERNHVFGGDC